MKEAANSTQDGLSAAGGPGRRYTQPLQFHEIGGTSTWGVCTLKNRRDSTEIEGHIGEKVTWF